MSAKFLTIIVIFYVTWLINLCLLAIYQRILKMRHTRFLKAFVLVSIFNTFFYLSPAKLSEAKDEVSLELKQKIEESKKLESVIDQIENFEEETAKKIASVSTVDLQQQLDRLKKAVDKGSAKAPTRKQMFRIAYYNLLRAKNDRLSAYKEEMNQFLETQKEFFSHLISIEEPSSQLVDAQIAVVDKKKLFEKSFSTAYFNQLSAVTEKAAQDLTASSEAIKKQIEAQTAEIKKLRAQRAVDIDAIKEAQQKLEKLKREQTKIAVRQSKLASRFSSIRFNPEDYEKAVQQATTGKPTTFFTTQELALLRKLSKTQKKSPQYQAMQKAAVDITQLKKEIETGIDKSFSTLEKLSKQAAGIYKSVDEIITAETHLDNFIHKYAYEMARWPGISPDLIPYFSLYAKTSPTMRQGIKISKDLVSAIPSEMIVVSAIALFHPGIGLGAYLWATAGAPLVSVGVHKVTTITMGLVAGKVFETVVNSIPTISRKNKKAIIASMRGPLLQVFKTLMPIVQGQEALTAQSCFFLADKLLAPTMHKMLKTRALDKAMSQVPLAELENFDQVVDAMKKLPDVQVRQRAVFLESTKKFIQSRTINKLTATQLIGYKLGSAAYSLNRDFLAILMDDSANLPDAWSDTQAHVRVGTDLSEQEKNFITVRTPKIQKSLSVFLDNEKDVAAYDKAPCIALCFSGGGYRAMLETVGSLMAAQETGLLDLCTYFTGLSGSTWALIPWIASGIPSVADYKESLKPKIDKPLTLAQYEPTQKEQKDIIRMLTKKWLDGQHIGITDIYGAVLANNLLQGIVPAKQDYPYALLANKIDSGNYPLPICTAVIGNLLTHYWMEFSPYEVGSFQLKSFIPTWALGRAFEKGASLPISRSSTTLQEQFRGKRDFEYPRAQTLGYFMGIWGSAFATTFKGLLPEIVPSSVATQLEISYSELLARLAAVSPDIESFGAAFVPNPTLDLKEKVARRIFGYSEQPLPLATMKEIALVDGGHDIVGVARSEGVELVSPLRLNIAIMPLLQPARKVDIIIIVDASEDLKDGAKSLVATWARALSMGLKFPKISTEQLKTAHTKHVSVFADKDPETPVVIYLPGIKNTKYDPKFNPPTSAFTSTFNFYYTPEQTDLLTGLTRQNMLDSMDTIKKVIKDVVERKSR